MAMAPPPVDISFLHLPPPTFQSTTSPFGHFIVSPPPTGSLLTHLPHPRAFLLPHLSLPPWSLYWVKNIRCGKSQSISATTVLHALVNISSLESLCLCLFLRTAVHLVSTFERKFPLPEPHDLQVDITQKNTFSAQSSVRLKRVQVGLISTDWLHIKRSLTRGNLHKTEKIRKILKYVIVVLKVVRIGWKLLSSLPSVLLHATNIATSSFHQTFAGNK